MSFLQQLITACLLSVLFFPVLSPLSALAQGADDSFSSGFEDVDAARTESGVRSFATPTDFIIAVLRVATYLIAALALAALVWGAIMYITSMGDEGKADTAKKVILYAIIGLIVLGAAGMVVNIFINIITE